MFSKLQESAARIDSGIRTLESKLPEVMYNYTDSNPDPQPILDRKADLNRQIAGDLRLFLKQSDVFIKLLNETVTETEDIENEIRLVSRCLEMEHCLVGDDSTDDGRLLSDKFQNTAQTSPDSPTGAIDSPNDSFDMSKIVIAKEMVPGQTTNTFTPLVRSKYKSRTGSNAPRHGSKAPNAIDSPNDSFDMSKIVIAKEMVPGQTTNTFTPLVRSKYKSRTDSNTPRHGSKAPTRLNF